MIIINILYITFELVHGVYPDYVYYKDHQEANYYGCTVVPL